MTADADALRTAVTELRAGLDAATSDAARRNMFRGDREMHLADPDVLQDANGRYLFLDARTALVNGLAALVNTP